MDDDNLHPANTEEEEPDEEVKESSTKPVLRSKKGFKKSASKVLVQSSILNAHSALKLQLEAEKGKLSLVEASESRWKCECESLKTKLNVAPVSL